MLNMEGRDLYESLSDTYDYLTKSKYLVLALYMANSDGDVAISSVEEALKAGYRHIDTAAVYGNEERNC